MIQMEESIALANPDLNATKTQSSQNGQATLTQVKQLLRAKDDTSRFVGLALLKGVLDKLQPNDEVSKHEVFEKLAPLWKAISPKFLDRLLRANSSSKVAKEESKDMVDLAVAVIHTFALLLPDILQDDDKLIGRTGVLLDCLVESSRDSTLKILQILSTSSSSSAGAVALLELDDMSALVEVAPQQPLALEILGFMWSNASLIEIQIPRVHASIDKIIPALVTVFRGTDAVTFLSFLGTFIPRIAPEALPRSPKWLKLVISITQGVVKSRPTQAGRTAYTSLAASLLQSYPSSTPSLLFNPPPADGSVNKPFSYLFINLLLIDLRASFPSLLSQLNSPSYPATSQRLGAAFDIISSFVGFLVRSVDNDSGNNNNDDDDDDDDDDDADADAVLAMPPSLLLQLRKSLAETLSLAVEFLRDRYDAAVAGAAGLHPAGRSGEAHGHGRPALTWEAARAGDGVHRDPLLLAGVRALALWLREDDNAALRAEAAGVTDLLVALYAASASAAAGAATAAAADGALDFRAPVLMALEPLVAGGGENGCAAFAAQDAWGALQEDLLAVMRTLSGAAGGDSAAGPGRVSEASRGIGIVRVLLAFVDSEFNVGEPREEAMAVVGAAAAARPAAAGAGLVVVHEFQIACLQLAAALLEKASSRVQRLYVEDVTAILGLSGQLKRGVRKAGYGRADVEELVESLEDVILSLENIRWARSI